VLNQSSRESRSKEKGVSGTLVTLDVASMTELLQETELRHSAYEASAAKHAQE